MSKKEINLIKFIVLRYADPISSMDLTDDYLLFGTMLGSTVCYIIDKNKILSLSTVQDEYISGVKIIENNLYICIGDLKILIYDLNPENINENSEIPFNEINNYKEEKDHNDRCENCLTMLNNNFLVRTFIEFPAEPHEEPTTKECTVLIKNILENDENSQIEKKIEMSNYSVPFDYDGKYFAFIDFIKENERKFNLIDFNSDNENINFEIEKFEEKIGHISHLKLLKNNQLFIVRDYNICEIRTFNFKLVKSLNIKSNEILAFDIMFENENNKENNIENNIEKNNENSEEKTKENISENNSENNRIDFKENKNKINIGNFYIILLDLDCNVILYNYNEDKSKILFNLEKDNLNIDNDIKEQTFFTFGYPYYIKMTKKYISISSDYGCILVQNPGF